jgi:hypothetical protein
VAQRKKIVFFMGYEVARDPSTKSGYGSAPRDTKGRGDLLGDLRLEAGAALLQHDWTQKIVTTGMVQREDSPGAGLNSALVIHHMLIHDFGIAAGRVEGFVEDGETTGGAIRQIQNILRKEVLLPRSCAVLTNFFHAVRTRAFLDKESLQEMPVITAEEVLIALAAHEDRAAVIARVERRLREVDLAGLVTKESKGLAALAIGEPI